MITDTALTARPPSGRRSPQTVGHIDQPIHPGQAGRVRYRGTTWFGVSQHGQVLPSGTEVQILGRQGNTLLVAPFLAEP